MKHIFPVFDQIINRENREELLNQRAVIIWFTGLSSSGKTTIAKGLEKRLYKEGYLTKLLDGDNLRSGINKNLGFTEEDREENIRRVGEVAKLFLNCGVITLCSFISPLEKIRNKAKEIVGTENFFLIYVNCSLETCEKRDVKGLYKKVREGKIKNFTGIHLPFEPPINPDFIINTDEDEINESIEKLYKKIIPHIKGVN